MVRSIDYANLIKIYTERTYGVTLGKTQVLKILYIIYGMYLAQHQRALFSDDKLQAWPYGPVFPNVYHRFDTEVKIIPENVLNEINEDPNAVQLIKSVIEHRYNWSALQLTLWSHEIGGPWYQAVYGSGEKVKWGAIIDDQIVQSYFQSYSL